MSLWERATRTPLIITPPTNQRRSRFFESDYGKQGSIFREIELSTIEKKSAPQAKNFPFPKSHLKQGKWYSGLMYFNFMYLNLN